MARQGVCVMHGKLYEEHICLYCCLCFKDLTYDECHVTTDGLREDVCIPCAEAEVEILKARQEKTDGR